MKSLRTIVLGIPIMMIAIGVAILASSTRAETPHSKDKQATASTPAKGGKLAKATFAGGCFWCMEPPFEKLPGVVAVTSGYTGGPENSFFLSFNSFFVPHATTYLCHSSHIVWFPSVTSYHNVLLHPANLPSLHILFIPRVM